LPLLAGRWSLVHLLKAWSLGRSDGYEQMKERVKSRHEAARIGARARWGPPRVVRLDQLDPAVAGVIRAILRAQENATKEADSGENDSASAEVRRVGVESTAA
jgi:hypothetical protein